MKLDDKLINTILREVKQQLGFMQLKDSKILSDIKKNIKDIKDDVNTVVNSIVEYYYHLITKSVNNDDYSYIYKYIEYYSSNNDFFNSFSIFILRINVDFNFDMCEKLLENSILSSKISTLVNKAINDNNIESLCKSNVIKSIVDVYCAINNIDIVVPDEEVDNFDIENCEDSLKIYLSEISKYPLLSIAEEKELLERYKKYNDEDARNKLIESNLRLVVSRAKRFYSASIQILDLISEGNIGLMRAIEKFDCTKSYKLSTYAVWWIDQKITRMIYNTGDMIRIPIHIREDLNRYKRQKNDLAFKLGKDVTFSEISSELKIPISKVENNELLLNSVVSLNQKIGDEEDTELGDLIPYCDSDNVEEKAENVLMKQHLIKSLDCLDDLNKTVIMLRYGLYDGNVKTLEETSKYLYKLGKTKTCVTRERVRQMEVSALRTLRFSSEIKNLSDFYGKPKNEMGVSLNYCEFNFNKKCKSIYECFAEYTESEVDLALQQLYPLQFELVRKYNICEGENMTYDEIQCINNIIIPKIRLKLRRNIKQKRKDK